MIKKAERRNKLARALLAALIASGFSSAAQAISFSVPWGEENSFEGVLNTTITIGAGMRMQDRAHYLVNKATLDPNVCGFPNQSCQGLFRQQGHPAVALSEAPGAFSPNFDDGNNNYDKHDLVSGLGKITQDLTVSYGDFGLFMKGLYFYDWVNADFEEFHPNWLDRNNKGDPGTGTTEGTLGGQVQYGPGLPTRFKRNNGEILRQAGVDMQLLDAYIYGRLPLWGEKELTFKIGRQTVNWGESTLLVLNSVNQVNAVNANNFFRVGFQVEEVFVPAGMVFLSSEPFENATLEGFYQYEWNPVEAPTPGTLFALSDLVGTNDAVPFAMVHFGGGVEDPDAVAFPLYNPLSGVTNTSTTIYRVKDDEPDDQGQYGLSFRYYAEDLNNGTELGFFFMNYHSKLPYASFFATAASCARREGNDLGIDAYDSFSFLATCPDLPFTHALSDDPENAESNAVPLDTTRVMIEYPEDIQMYGFSFNTTAGDFSFQGEVAFRPNLPLQVDAEDLVFAAFGPTLSRCHDPNLERSPLSAVDLNLATEQLSVLTGAVGLGVPNPTPLGFGCAGSTAGIGSTGPGSSPNIPGGAESVYGPSDFVIDANETRGGFADTFDLAIGHAVGSSRSFPAFVTPYRGTVAGENQHCEQEFRGSNKVPQREANRNPNFIPYTRDNPCYIRGYERLDVFQFNLGGTYVFGSTDRISSAIGADQILSLFEFGATWVPDMPGLDELQLEADGTYTHASAGADGSGSDRSRQACSYNPDGSLRQSCSFGTDGLRFNPHQQELKGFPDPLSWGYVLINLVRYESVLPGISFQYQIIWKHDVEGTSPGPGGNFVHGRKTADILWETRYKSNFSFNMGYTWFTGGGKYNIYRDKDVARAFVKFQF